MVQSAAEQASFREQHERFAVFLRRTDQSRVSQRATIDGLQTNYPDIWRRVQDQNYPFSAYFMGAGSGGKEIPLTLDLIKARRAKTNIELFCEDPSPEMHEQFQAAAQKVGIEELVRNYNALPFDEPSYKPPDADFSLASQVWYYIGGWKGVATNENTLVKFTNSVKKKDGVGLITVYSNTSDRYTLLKHFLSNTGKEPESAGEEITKELDRLGIEYKVDIIEAHTDISPCFQDGIFKPTEEGILLLSFLLRTNWKDLSDKIKQQVEADLTSIVQKNGKEVMNFNDSYIWMK